MNSTDSPSPAQHPPDEIGFEPTALIAAIAFPGAGHAVRGELKRGIGACAGVMGLFLGGLLVGGIDVVDSKEDRFWFFGQALVGPAAFGVDYYHQNYLKVVETRGGRTVSRTAYPNEGRDPATGRPVIGGTPPNFKSVSKINELGMLSCCLAGMMNLIIVIDAGWPVRRGKKEGGA
ncbi:MAG: DUF6677 family protein [Phycisphaerales bacterium]